MPSVIPSSRLVRSGVAVLALAVMVGVSSPVGAISDQDVEQARQAQQEAAAARAAAITDANDAAAAYEAVNSQYQSLVFRIGEMRSRIEAYRQQVEAMRDQLRQNAVEAYMRGPGGDLGASLYTASSAQQALVVQQVLARAVEQQAASLSSLQAITSEMERLQADLQIQEDQAASLRIEAEAIANRMYELLAEREAALSTATENLTAAEAALAEQRRREEEERQARLAEERRQELIRLALAGPAAGVSEEVTPGFICPVAPGVTAYVNSWGDPRPGGRIHVGTDMMGSRDTPLLAVADGTIRLGESVLGGNTVWLYSDHGTAYFYAHLDYFVSGQVSGQRVTKGTVIGYMGDTGDPAPGAYHLHFEIHPNGGGAVNPYPTLVRHSC
jgi:murein DD-endopeptidase MepM/ murein hydrolase activator NlpD